MKYYKFSILMCALVLGTSVLSFAQTNPPQGGVDPQPAATNGHMMQHDHTMQNMKEHQLTKKEVKALIVSAKTSEDHMKLASYFRSEAQRQDASATYHDEMAELYRANPLPKVDMVKHCKFFSDAARKAAEAANEMAAGHDKVAAQLREQK